jgi:hypothetical protein
LVLQLGEAAAPGRPGPQTPFDIGEIILQASRIAATSTSYQLIGEPRFHRRVRRPASLKDLRATVVWLTQLPAQIKLATFSGNLTRASGDVGASPLEHLRDGWIGHHERTAAGGDGPLVDQRRS